MDDQHPVPPACLVVTRRRGRPPNVEPTCAISTRLREQDVDRLLRAAAARRCSLAELARSILEAALHRAQAGKRET